MATPSNLGGTPPSRDVSGDNVLDRLGDLVGTPFEYGAWDYQKTGTMDCIGMLTEFGNICNLSVPWETQDWKFVKELCEEISKYKDLPDTGGGEIRAELFREMATTIDYSTGDLSWLIKWMGREVSIEEVRPLDILFLKLLPNDPVINHIAIMHRNRKFLHTVPRWGLRLMPFTDAVKKRVKTVVRFSQFEG